MSHTLVTMLGKSRESKDTGYRETTYRFPDGTEYRTAFFGLALSRHLEPDATVILGTSGSQWDVLVEHLAGDNAADEEARLQLIEAAGNGDTGAVHQALLDRLTPLMNRAVGGNVLPRLIPFGRDEEEQYRILETVASTGPKKGSISFDLTHGFRHLGMVGFLSAFMLERVRNLNARDLWYGALDMTRDGITPVLKLDGLVRVRRWLDALDRFDATGDYGVFAPLLIADGVPADKAGCLKEAAFYERTLNVRDAARKIGTFLPLLDGSLAGASGLFQDRLADRLRWARDRSNVVEQQRMLAHQYLERGDFVRAAMFGREAFVTRVCDDRGVSSVDYSTERKEAVDAFERELNEDEEKHSEERAIAYLTLTFIRNALAHGTRLHRPSRSKRQRPRGAAMLAAADAIKDPVRLERELKSALDRFFR